MDKKLKEIPWGAFKSEGCERYKITVQTLNVQGERVTVVTFMANEQFDGVTASKDISLRLFLYKKSGHAEIIDKNGQSKKNYIRAMLGKMWLYFLLENGDKVRLQRFLNTTEENTQSLMRETLKCAENIQKAEKLERDRSKGKLLETDVSLCPEELPEGLEQWIRRYILPKDNVLLFQKGGKRGRCYLCGEEIHFPRGEEAFRHGQGRCCPNCAEYVIALVDTNSHWNVGNVGNLIAVQKGTDGKTIFFRQWRLLRDGSGTWAEITPYLKEVARYAIRGKETAKWQKEGKEAYFYHYERYDLKEWKKWQGNQIYEGTYHFYSGNTQGELAGTVLQYADLNGYLLQEGWRGNAVYFLEYFAKYPVTEFLWKAGYHCLLREKINGMNQEQRNVIRWRRKKLQECFKLPLRFLKYYPPGEWTMSMLHIANQMYAIRGETLGEGELREAIEERGRFAMITTALGYAKVGEVKKYIEKQNKRINEKMPLNYAPETIEHTMRDYRDYVGECHELELDLNDRGILFPKDLEVAHQRTMEQVEYENNKEDIEKFNKMVSKLQVFAWEFGELLIRPAGAWGELREEGKRLNHCVGGYVKEMAHGKTAIFFIRQKSNPEISYYTLELNPKTKEIRQCRGQRNIGYERDEVVKIFVDTWLKDVVKKDKKMKVA